MSVSPVGAVGRSVLAPVVVFVVSGVAIVIAYVVERGNAPYTLNFREPADIVVVTVMFSVGVLGTVVLLMRPGHRTGQLMLWSGFCWATGLVCHAVAVRMVMVWPPRTGIAADTAAWVATFALVPAFGLLTFVPATWPTGRVNGRWLRALTVLAAVALALMTVAQAFAPDRLDGVRHRVIGNPLGVPVLATPVAVLTGVTGVCLACFAVVSLGDLVRRAVGSRGERRRPYRPVLVALGFAMLAAAVSLPWLGGTRAVGVGAGWLRWSLSRSASRLLRCVAVNRLREPVSSWLLSGRRSGRGFVVSCMTASALCWPLFGLRSICSAARRRPSVRGCCLRRDGGGSSDFP